MKTSFLLFEKQNVLAPPKSHQTSRFAVTVFIHVSNHAFLGKISYNFVDLHFYMFRFPHVTSTCLVVIEWKFGTRTSTCYDVTSFYVQEYLYFKNAIFYKGSMPEVTKCDVITLKQNI